MKHVADAVLNLPLANKRYPDPNFARLSWDLKNRPPTANETFCGNQPRANWLPKAIFEDFESVYFEIGAGTGDFILSLAGANRDTACVAIERCRHRAKRLVIKSKNTGLNNLFSFRGNIIPAMIHGVPDSTLDRIYILYPCPWPKSSQRKNRWYLHPVMPHFLRCLKPNGMILWTSDQKFYIDEAEYVSRTHFGLKTLVHSELRVNDWNGLKSFPLGRTKFERSFMAANHPCYELISVKP